MSATATTTPAPAGLSALRGYFETSLYLLLLVSVLALTSTGKLDLVSMLVTPAALLFKGYRWWHGHGPELSNRAANWLVGIYFIFFPVDLWWVSRALSSDAQDPGLFAALLAVIHLMLFAIVVRLFSARAVRDCMFLALLAFSAMLASAILTVDTAFIGFFLVFLGLGISTLVGLEMRLGADGAIWTPVESGTPSARRLHTALGLTSAGIALTAIIVGALIFLALPRFRAGYLSGFNLQPQLMSGFSDDAELGQIGQIQQSNEIVMRIRVDGGPAAAENVHWRGIAFTNFDGRRWYTDNRESRAVVQDASDWILLHPPTSPARPHSTPLHYTIMLEPLASDAIFVANDPAQIRGDFTNNGALGGRGIRRSYLLEDRTGSISNPFHNFANVRYEAVSDILHNPDAILREAPQTYPNSIRDMYLQLPQLDSRIAPLARRIVAGASTPIDQARAIERYFPANFVYSLSQTGPAPADPLAHFLFDTRSGHCEYFASAMTILLRTLGIPSRYVTGFLGGDYNDLGGDYIIRAKNAHSWVEAYFPGYGWLTFDPTPPSDDRPTGLLTRLGFYWDWFQLQWGEWVVNYDFIRQDTLIQGVRNASRDWSTRIQNGIDRVRDASSDRLRQLQASIKTTPLWIPIALAILMAVGICLSSAGSRERLVLAWRLRFRRTGAAVSLHAASLSYRHMLRLLERRGWKKSPHQTPLEFAAGLPGTAVTAPVTGLTRMYQAARFGNQPADAGKLTSLLAELQAALRNTPSAS